MILTNLVARKRKYQCYVTGSVMNNLQFLLKRISTDKGVTSLNQAWFPGPARSVDPIIGPAEPVEPFTVKCLDRGPRTGPFSAV